MAFSRCRVQSGDAAAQQAAIEAGIPDYGPEVRAEAEKILREVKRGRMTL